MAHWNDTRIAIESRFNTGFTATAKRYWSNAPFDVPSVAYVAIQIEEFDEHQITLGTAPQTHRHFGQITLQVFVPERTGPVASAGYLETLDDLFRRAQFSSGNSGVITCRTAGKREVGVRDGWYQVNLVIPYQRDKSH